MDSREVELRMSGGSWSRILESMSEGVIVLDREGLTTFANAAAEEVTGYGVEDLIGVSDHELLRHSDAEGTPYPLEDCPLCGAFRRGEPHQTSNEAFWAKDGSMLPVGYASDPLIEDGETVGAVVIFRGVLARRQALEETEQRFKNLMEESREGLVLTENEEIFEANTSLLRSFGYEREEVVGSLAAELVLPEDREAVAHRSSSGSMETYEARGLRKDGTTLPMEIQPRNFPYGGREARLSSVIDITERKEAERAPAAEGSLRRDARSSERARRGLHSYRRSEHYLRQ